MTSLETMFATKYDEFCTDLEGACPELINQIKSAKALSKNERFRRFRTDVLPNAGLAPGETRDLTACPGTVLPGVIIKPALWTVLSDSSKKAIHEYVTLLSISSLYGGGGDDKGAQPDFLKGFMDSSDFAKKMAGIDINAISSKFKEFMTTFTSSAGADGGPSIPEKFMKGHIARLAEDLVKEFKATDFGLSEEELLACEENPSKAFELLMKAYTDKPEVLQKAMQRIAKRMQEKIQKGELKPQDLASEAEELMKTCTDNPAFKEMLETLKNAFGFEDMATARAQGQEGSARLALVRNRLKAKLEKKNAGKR